MSFIAPRVDPPLEGRRDLVTYIENGAKPPSLERVGIEMESLPLHARTGAPVPFLGDAGVEEVLRRLSGFACYQDVVEEGHLVLLRCHDRTIGLEPGGQLELSGTPALLLSEIKAELGLYLREIEQASEGLSIAWVGMGEHPVATLDDIPWVPKPRYRILSSFLQGRGALGHHMMKKTATVQASFDFTSAGDAMRKLRAGLLLTPVVIALSANSPYADGQYTGYVSHRTIIWEQTDPSRSGRFPQALAPGFDLEAYVDHVLDLPLIFLRRGERWLAPQGLTFRGFLEHGFEGERATLFDWELHLSTFFPDTRVKQVVEVRGADCPPARLVVPLVSFFTGILYSEAGLSAVDELLGRLPPADHAALHHEAAKNGMAGAVGSLRLAELCHELLGAATRGLRERAAKVGADESDYLDPLRDLVDREQSPAHELLARFGERVADPAKLIRARRMRL